MTVRFRLPLLDGGPNLIRKLSLIAITLLLSLRCMAQTTSAELSGTVQDSSGAAIPGARIVVTNTTTNVAHSAVSGKIGEYIIGQLPPGDYNVTVDAKGFSKLTQTGLNLQVNQQARLDLTLKIGQQSETVTVSAQQPLLESESSSIGTVIDKNLVNQLPLNERNFTQLATLSPGVTGVGESASGTIQSGTRPDDKRPASEIFANGNRDGDNNFLYDGIDDNERLTLSIVVRPVVEAVREFKINTSLNSAELGRNAGATIDVITKSGTNSFHGSAFEYLRNSAMDARTYFNAAGTAFPAFRMNQFGGSLGGPVWKNKVFFFADYEGFRNSTQNFILGNIPTVRERTGDFSELCAGGFDDTGLCLSGTQIYDPTTTRANPTVPGAFLRDPYPYNVIPTGKRDPIAMIMINAYPAPTSGALTNNYASNTVTTNDSDSGDGRIDAQLTAKDSIFGRYTYQTFLNLSPPTYPRENLAGVGNVGLSDEGSFAGTSTSPAQHLALGYTRVVSQNIVNDLRGGLSRYGLNYVPLDFVANGQLGNKLGVPNSNVTPREQNLPIFSPSSYLGVGQSRSLPLYRQENTYQILDNVVWTRGSHTLKFGADFRHRNLTIYQTNEGNGRFNFSPALTDSRNPAGKGGNSVASFMAGYATLIAHDYTFPFPVIEVNEYGLYAADDWRVTRKLTLNYGLRWDYFSPPTEAKNQWANFNPVTGNMDIAGQNGVDAMVGVQPWRKGFGPRLGFSWQPYTNTVVRGGGGVFFNDTGSESVTMRLFRNVPFGQTISDSPGDIFPGQTVSQGFGPAPSLTNTAAVGAMNSVDLHYRPSYAQQFSLGVEQQVTQIAAVLKITGVGNLGRHLYNAYNINQAVPGSTSVNSRRPLYGLNPNVGDVTYATGNGAANYYGLQVTLDKHISHGVSALVGYAWAHAIDDVPMDFGGGAAGPSPQDPRNLNAERSNSYIDQRQRLTVSYLWELPFGKGRELLNHGGPVDWVLGGWQTNGAIFSQTGLYFSPVLQTATVNTGTTSRPNQIGTVHYPKTLNNWFDASAFVNPPPYTYGDAGRNSLIGPGRTNFDLALMKKFPIRETMNLQFRFEAFNIFNHPQFGYPNPNVGNSQVGQITSIVGNPRNLQASLHFEF